MGKREKGWENINVSRGRVQGPRTLPVETLMSFHPFPYSLVPIPYAVNELPQPQPPVEFGFLNVNPEPCMDET
jgi:hypothetical protein